MVKLDRFQREAFIEQRSAVHVANLMTAAGALIGFCAQQAIWETVVATGKMPVQDSDRPERGAFLVMRPNESVQFFFGKLLDSYLVPDSHEAVPLGPGQHTLWSYFAALVAKHGGQPLTDEQLDEIFRNTANTIGTQQFGQPRLPEAVKLQIAPRYALNRSWPAIKNILTTEVPEAREVSGLHPRLAPAYWPAVITGVTL